MRLGKMLRTTRLLEGATTRALAARIGISPATLNRIESGKSCDMRSLVKLLAWMMIAEDDGKLELVRE